MIKKRKLNHQKVDPNHTRDDELDDQFQNQKEKEKQSNYSTDPDDWRPGDGPHPSD